jgi:hypothetical protein
MKLPRAATCFVIWSMPPCEVTVTDREIEVRFQKRAHNPLLLAAGFHKTNLPIPWLDGKHLRLVFG